MSIADKPRYAPVLKILVHVRLSLELTVWLTAIVR